MTRPQRCQPSRQPSARAGARAPKPLRLFAALLGVVICLGCPGFGERDLQSVVSNSTEALCVDVQNVLQARCNQCHSSPPTGGAPRYLRLDSLSDVDGVEGAVSQANRSLSRAEGGTMPPPAFGRMTEDEVDVLSRWVAAGTPVAECESTGQALPSSDVLDQADIGVDAP